MSTLKFKNADGTWNGIAAFKGEDGKDGAIQYKAGYGIKIEDNVISSTLDPENDITVDTNPTEGSVNPVSSGGVYNALAAKANAADIPTDLGDFTNGPGYITEEKEEGFNSSVAASITNTDISNWNSKQPAGNYITPDYLTANIISDLVKVHSYTSPFGSTATGMYTSSPICAAAAKLINDIYNSGRKGMVSVVYDDGASDIINNLISVNTTLTSYNLMSPRYNTFMRISGSWSSGVFACSAVAKYKLMDNYYLSKTNTTAYTPTSDYHPATKLYVDNKVAESVSEGLAGSGFLSEEADPIFTNHVASSITEEDITNWNNKADDGGITEESDPTVPVWVKSITEDDITNWNNKLTSSDLPSDLGDLTNNAGYTTATDVLNTIRVDADLLVTLLRQNSTSPALYSTSVGAENITFTNFNKDVLDAYIKQELTKLIDAGYDPNRYPTSIMMPIKVFNIQTYIPIMVSFNKVNVRIIDGIDGNEEYESDINDYYLQRYTRYISSKMSGVIDNIKIECSTRDLDNREVYGSTISFLAHNIFSSMGVTPGGYVQLNFRGNYISDSNITLGDLTNMWFNTDYSIRGQDADIQFSLNSKGHYLLMISGKQESDSYDSEYNTMGYKLTLNTFIDESIEEFIRHHKSYGFDSTSLGVSISNFRAADNYYTAVSALLHFDGVAGVASNPSIKYIQYMGVAMVNTSPLKYTTIHLKLTVDSDTYELLEVSFSYTYPLTKAFEPYYTTGYDSSKTQTLKNVEGTLTWVDD